MIKRENLIGAWRLIAFEAETDDGEVVLPYSDSPDGRLIYTESGIMSAHLGASGRPGFADMGASGGARAVAAMKSHFSYAGRWRLDGDRVIHDVDMSIFPDWVGAEKIRTVAFDDGDMILTDNDPTGPLRVGRLRWRREE